MTMSITPELASRFQQLGSHTHIQQGGIIEAPERMTIGHGVSIRAPYTLSVTGAWNEPPAIVIGDGCKLCAGVNIIAKSSVLLERNVLIDANVHIRDEVNMGVNPLTGVTIPVDLATTIEGQVTISEGAWVGANSILLGDIRIGTGSIVKPNSVVLHDVPDYCVVSGCPAVIVEIYDPTSGEWISVSGNEQVLDILESRRRHPLLSICIPTFNRAPHFEHCLQSIYSQIGNNDLIEVIVSDNASTDETFDIAQQYAARYSNLRIVRNEENIGADRNIFSVMNLARGKFVKLQGDDDFYIDDTLLPLLHVLHSHGDCGVIQIFVRNGNGHIWSGSGMSDYLKATSIYATFITSIILRREDLERIKEPALFVPSSFNQLYLQYAILENNPKFCIMNNSMFTYAGISSDEYNFGEVIFRSYQSILRHFIGKGLNEEDIRREKRRTLYEYAIPWYRQITSTRMIADTEGFEKIYNEHYQDEPYYEEALAIISAIQPS